MRGPIGTLPEHEPAGLRTYAETVARGFYDRPSEGLRGKYDNVRIYWEDRITRATLRPFVGERDRAARAQGRGVRVLDLGCGAGQGYELLTRIDQEGLRLSESMRFVLPADHLGLYLGLDFSEAMIEKGQENYTDRHNVRFQHADLRDGITTLASELPFDICFSSYGALSHLGATALKRCLATFITHAEPGALAVLDLVGRYSLEWPNYWNAVTEDEKTRPYSMSYLYDAAERQSGRVECFPIRFWTGEEVRALCLELTAETGIAIETAEVLDRSVFVGRHVDTREYGCTLPPLRGLTNRLYEQNVRTPLDDLRVDTRPASPNQRVNHFFTSLADSWNQVIDFTLARLGGLRIQLVDLEGWRDFPLALQVALMSVDRMMDSVASIDVGDTRANIVEPQLAAVLQRLECSLQAGLGCGHGLVAVLRIGKQVQMSRRSETA